MNTHKHTYHAQFGHTYAARVATVLPPRWTLVACATTQRVDTFAFGVASAVPSCALVDV